MEKMRLKICLLFLVLLVINGHLYAQELSVGPVSGINFSNLRGDLIYDTWSAKTGPVGGIFARFSFGNWLALRSGAEFTSFYYQENRPRANYYSNPNPILIPAYSSSSIVPGGCIIGPSYPVALDYHFLRLPLLLEWSTPGRLSFGFNAGVYYSFLVNDEYTGKDKELYAREYQEDNFPPENDWGWMLSTTLDFSITEKWNVFLEGRTTYGKEIYYSSVEGKNGSTELLFGVGFSPFARPEREHSYRRIGRRIEVMPHTGVSFSKSVASKKKDDYAFLPALNSGVFIKFKIDSIFSLISGARYEQKGYRIKEPSQSRIIFDRYVNSQSLVDMQSDVLFDYLTIPLMGELSFGKQFTTNLQFGMYYSLLQNVRVIGEATYKYTSGSGYRIQKEYFSQNREGWFNNSDLGVLAGFRLEYRIFPKTKIYAGLNRAWGIFGLADKADDNSNDSAPVNLEKFKNRSWTSILGLSIPLVHN